MKPMLAAKTDGKKLRYPLIASPKLDGVRALVIGGRVYSRTLKLIPNRYIQATLGKPALNGWDGELCVGSPCAKDVYRKTTSGVMTELGEPSFAFHAFDRYDLKLPFYRRYRKLIEYMEGRNIAWLKLVPHFIVEDRIQLNEYEQNYLAEGYEGLMLRHPEAPYKQGRSTEKEGWLLKLKRFDDSEAVIIEIVELMHNDNPTIVNALGKQERSSCKANKRSGNTMGSIRVRDIKSKVEFDIGTGFDATLRKTMWDNHTRYIGKVIKYKYFHGGIKDKPRFPVFLGFRERIDI